MNIKKIRTSKCNCAFAEGRNIVCKHMVVLYYTIFPEEADRLIKLSKLVEEEEELKQKEYHIKVVKYVNSLTKEEKKETLINYIEYDNDFYI